MAKRNLVQFQKGMSITIFLEDFGTEEKCAGSLFERTKFRLAAWFQAIFLITQGKKGISAMDLMRKIGVSYNAVWRMKHKIMQRMMELENEKPLAGRNGRHRSWRPWRRRRIGCRTGSSSRWPPALPVSSRLSRKSQVDCRAANSPDFGGNRRRGRSFTPFPTALIGARLAEGRGRPDPVSPFGCNIYNLLRPSAPKWLGPHRDAAVSAKREFSIPFRFPRLPVRLPAGP